jgi:hypothetical protein
MSYDISLLVFLNKYEHQCYDIKNFQTDEFKKDWDGVKDKYKDDIPSIRLLLEQLIEKRFPTFLIKELFNAHSDKDEIKKNEDLFKWAAAFHGKQLINFLYLNMEVKNEQGAVNAAIINFRLDNLQALNELGINIFSEKHFCQAIGRSHQPNKSDIIEYYLENRDKFQITEYGNQKLKEHTRLIEWVIQKDDFDKVKYLFEQGVGANRGNLLKDACSEGSLNRVKYILHSKDFNILKENKKLTSKEIDEAFIFAASGEHHELINYFISEYNLKYSNGLKRELKSYELTEIQKLFEVRDDRNTLEKELPTQEVVAPKPKLKL